jgi:hypothetical protein
MKLKIMADYSAHATWLEEGAEYNVDPSTLGLSAQLQADLAAWSEDYTATLNQGDPASSGFPNATAERLWIERGRVLARRVAEELGPSAEVRYHE